jgi:hypothetical protein
LLSLETALDEGKVKVELPLELDLPHDRSTAGFGGVGARLQPRPGPSPRVPQSKDFDAGGSRPDSVLELVVDAAEVDPPDAGQLHVGRSGTDLGIQPDQGQSVSYRLVYGAGGGGSVLLPPL